VVAEPTPAFVRLGRAVPPAYNEAAFRYFLALEKERAERAVHPLFVMLVRFGQASPNRKQPSQQLFATVFSVLNACIREVDFTGWYREGLVAAAVLTSTGPSGEQVRQHLAARVAGALKPKLPPDAAARLQVRVHQLIRKSSL
jgi:hypothetical protein